MSVVIETTLGDITVDLFFQERPRAALNFLKLCKIKYYNFNLFHTIERGFIAQTGDPTGSRDGGDSIFGVIHGPQKRFFPAEKFPQIKHNRNGLLSFVGNSGGMIGSQFFVTLGEDLSYLDERHCVFGEVMEGLDVLELLNETICDSTNTPYKDVRITHTVILNDPYPDIDNLVVPSRSPSPSAERLKGGRIAPDEEIDDTRGKNQVEIQEMVAEREAKARATILEIVGDIPKADMAPPENVLFVCKLNPVTSEDDLVILFGRFGAVVSCEVIRDKKTGESLQYAFVEFDKPKACEEAYFKMDNVLIDDRRIHVDFSQSVSKIRWFGKGRGITTYDDQGRRTNDGPSRDLGKGIYAKDSGHAKVAKKRPGWSSPRSQERSPARREWKDERKNVEQQQHRKRGDRSDGRRNINTGRRLSSGDRRPRSRSRDRRDIGASRHDSSKSRHRKSRSPNRQQDSSRSRHSGKYRSTSRSKEHQRRRRSRSNSNPKRHHNDWKRDKDKEDLRHRLGTSSDSLESRRAGKYKGNWKK